MEITDDGSVTCLVEGATAEYELSSLRQICVKSEICTEPPVVKAEELVGRTFSCIYGKGDRAGKERTVTCDEVCRNSYGHTMLHNALFSIRFHKIKFFPPMAYSRGFFSRGVLKSIRKSN